MSGDEAQMIVVFVCVCVCVCVCTVFPLSGGPVAELFLKVNGFGAINSPRYVTASRSVANLDQLLGLEHRVAPLVGGGLVTAPHEYRLVHVQHL